MIAPLAVLAILSLAGGYFAKVPDFLEKLFPALHEAHDMTLVAISVCGRFAGHRPGLCHVRGQARGCADSHRAELGGLYRLVYNKYFVDEIYDAAVVKPMVAGSRSALEGRGCRSHRWKCEWHRKLAGRNVDAVLRLFSPATFAVMRPGWCWVRSFSS